MTTESENINEVIPSEFLFEGYVTFDVTTDCMNTGKIDDTERGATLLCLEVDINDYPELLMENDYGFVILTTAKSYFKDLLSYDIKTGTLLLSDRESMNNDTVHPDYADLSVHSDAVHATIHPDCNDLILHRDDILQIFKVVKRYQ